MKATILAAARVTEFVYSALKDTKPLIAFNNLWRLVGKKLIK